MTGDDKLAVIVTLLSFGILFIVALPVGYLVWRSKDYKKDAKNHLHDLNKINHVRDFNKLLKISILGASIAAILNYLSSK